VSSSGTVDESCVQTHGGDPADDGDEMTLSKPCMYRLEWEYLADILDRLLLVVFLLLATFVTATVFAFGVILEEIAIPAHEPSLTTTTTQSPPDLM
jgi:hypothetical protein